MPLAVWTRWKDGLRRPPRRHARHRRRPRLELEILEHRIVLSGNSLLTATPLDFTAFHTAQAAHFLSDPREVDLYQVTLNAGDQLSAAVAAQTAGSGLTSLLRVFKADGTQLALDDREGGDPQLAFQAATAGPYYIGVSSAPNNNYDPNLANSGTAGGTTGLYTLNLRLTASVPLEPSLTAGSFRLTTGDTAAYGDTVQGTFTVENRGGAAAGAFDIQVFVSTTNQFSAATSQVLKTYSLPGLAANSAFSPGNFTVTLPGAPPAGFPASGPVYVGVRVRYPAPFINGDFETGDFTGWTTGGGNPTPLITATGAHSGTYSAVLGTPGAHGAEPLGDSVIQQSFTVVAALPSLSFWHLDSTTDSLKYDWQDAILIDGGGTAHTIFHQANDSGGVWAHTTYDLTPYVGQTVTLRFLVHQDGYGDLTSMYVDDVACTGAQGSVHRGADWEKLTIVTPAPAGTTNLSSVGPNLNTRVNDTLTGSAQTKVYTLTVKASQGTGRLTLQVVPTGNSTLVPRLTLSDGPTGRELTTTDSGTIVQNLQPGTYLLTVSAQTGAGAYTLTTQFVQTSPPFGPIAVNFFPNAVAVADLTGDGTPDLVVTNERGNYGGDHSTVSVVLGNGDGTFQPQHSYHLGGYGADAVAVADLNGDGKPDLVVVDYGNSSGTSGTVSVLMGNGDGTFQAPQTYPVGYDADAVAVADLNGDGKPDLIVANYGKRFDNYGTVSVLLGNGDGTFQTQQTFAVGDYPQAVAVADLNGDGRPDLIVANEKNNTVSVLTGNGDGTFRARRTFTLDSPPTLVAVADLNGDGKPDLVVGSRGYSRVDVLLGNGDGTFQAERSFAVGVGPLSVAVADLNGDGKQDITTANFDGTVGVLLGNGDGTFQPQHTFTDSSTGGGVGVAVADLNNDGKPDVVVADGSNGKTVDVLLGDGDGAFQQLQSFTVGAVADAVAVADVNRDGKPDVVTASESRDSVSVLLGEGDGTLQPQRTFAVGLEPWAVAVADLNGDGKPDVVTADNLFDNTVSVLLGTGDGTLQPRNTFAVGDGPDALAVADLNGDGKPDLVVTNRYDNTVSVLLGNGDGTFQVQRTFAVGSHPSSVALGDLDGDGKPDIVVANRGSKTVSVLLGNGDGTFKAQHTFTVAGNPGSVAVVDVNADGKADLVVANTANKGVSVLLGNGNGTFQPQHTFTAGGSAMAVADINSDGKPDIVTAASTVVSVLLGRGDGSFTLSTPSKGVEPRNTPYLADFTGNGTADSVILDSAGNILFRQGLPGNTNQFAPPVTLNETLIYNPTETGQIRAAGDLTVLPGSRIDPATGELEGKLTARDLTALHTTTGWAVATADASPDVQVLATQHRFVYSVSVYTDNPDTAKFQRITAFTTNLVPTRIAAADLTGDGLDDIVVANSLDNSIQVAFQQPSGTFSNPLLLPTATAPSDISFVDVNGDGRLDIVVTNQASGEVSVFLNDPAHSFAVSHRFRAGTGLVNLDTTPGAPGVTSLLQPVSLAAGNFTADGGKDVVVVNRDADGISVLRNDGNGGFTDPQSALTTSTSDGSTINDQAGPVVAGDFNGDGHDDVAILMENSNQVWIYTGDGQGHFTHSSTIAVSSLSTGLSMVRDPQTGFLDLLVGDEFGDVLHLQGKGDGTFQFAGNRVSLAVQELSNGQPTVLVANQQTDTITIQAPVPGTPQFAPVVSLVNGTQSTLAPGAVYWAKLEGPGSRFDDAVVVASGANEILVYHATGLDVFGRPTFAPPQAYFVGTDPVSVTIQDFNGDNVPDLLIADQGSNDVAILFGKIVSGQWVGTPGPRLKSGGSGPIAVSLLSDPRSSGGNDLLVANAQSGNFAVLPGVGQGFFNDQNPQVFSLPGNPVLLAAPLFFGPSGNFVVLTAGGRIEGGNLSDLAETRVLDPNGPAVDALGVLPDGNLVAANADGNVQELRLDSTTGLLDPFETFDPLTSIPSDPSALAVLQTGNVLEVLVTSAGSDQLFVYRPAEPVREVVELFSSMADGPATTGVLVSVSAVIPLSADTEPSNVPATLFTQAIPFLVEGNLDITTATKEDSPLNDAAGGMGDEQAGLPQPGEADLLDFLTGVEQRLPRLREQLRTKSPDTSRLDTPADDLRDALDRLFAQWPDEPAAPVQRCYAAEPCAAAQPQSVAVAPAAVPQPLAATGEPAPGDATPATPTEAEAKLESVEPQPLMPDLPIRDAVLIEVVIAAGLVGGVIQVPLPGWRRRGERGIAPPV